jgi:class 3 adenylate cyclase/tetratricopeptide (TPR) repeat protein
LAATPADKLHGDRRFDLQIHVTTNVRQWLEALGLPQYAEAFEANDIDADLLRSLSDQILKDIGVASAGHRLRMLAATARLASAGPPLAQPDALRRSSDGERRQATVLIADISGYTALCARLDPEQVQALLARFYEVTDGIIANYGGHVIDHAGDGTFASFGAPIAHGNDAERAVRAALDMQVQVPAIVDPTGQALTLHAGIASGEVVAATIAAGAQSKYAITGDAVNLAARLSSIAEPGQMLLSDAAWGAVSRIFDGRSLGEAPIKGIGRPVSLWSVTGLRRGVAERRSFVGRQAELRQLLGVLDAAQKNASGLAVCMLGEAGIGKSRLVEELRERAKLRGFDCHCGYVLDFGVGKGQDAIAAIVKDVLEASPQSDEPTLRAAVRRAVSSGLIASDQEILINDLLELPQSAEQRAAFDAMDNSTRIQRLGETLAGILQRGAQLRPRLVVVEDIQWASPDLLRYLALLGRAAGGSRIVLVMTSRFEGYPLDQGWRASAHGSPLLTVNLEPLRPEESRLLAAGLMQPSNRLARECIERADGNPLFLEQLLRAAAEAQASSLPASIQSLVLARMDRLGQRDKSALQTASVIGKRFGIAALRALADDPEYSCDVLIDADLVRPDGPEYVFAHALIQEGVYASLLHARKRELHRRAADWFGEEEPILRAEHLDRASDPAAAAAYLAAATAQTARFRHESALRLADRGLEIAIADSVRSALLLLRGDLLREGGRSSESLAAFQTALDLAADDNQRCQAWMGIVAGHRVTTDIPAAMAALDRAQAIAERLAVSGLRSRIHHVRGNLFFATGDSSACRREHEAALHHAQQAGDVECEAQALSGIGDALYLQGRMLTALDRFERCVALCEDAGLTKVQIANRCMVGHCLYYANRMDESIAAIRRALEDARRLGQAQAEIFTLESLGLLLGAKGDYEAAEQALMSGIPLARAAAARRYLSVMLYDLADLKLVSGARDEARACLDEALDLAQQTGMAFSGPLVLSGIACAEPDPVQAKRALEQGEAVLREPCVSHCHLHFYRNAIEVSLRWHAWNEACRYAGLLERYVQAEPLPWATLVVARGRALAAVGVGEISAALPDRLKHIRDEIERVGMHSALPGVNLALETLG